MDGEEELGNCSFLQVSLQSDAQLDLQEEGIRRYGPGLASPVLTVICFGLLVLVARGAPWREGRGSQDGEGSKGGLPITVLVLMGLTMGLDFFCTDQYQPSMLHMSHHFGVAGEAMASTIQIHQMCCALAMPCVGRWLCKHGIRPMILCCQLFFAASTLSCAFSPSFGWFAAGRALQGISASSSVAISAMLSAAYTDRREMLRAANLVSCIALVGHIAGPAAGGFLASAFGWRFGFLAVFCLAALITLANYLLLPDLTTEKAPEAPTATEGGNGRILWRQLLVLMGLSLLRGSSYVVMSTNSFVFEAHYGLSIQRAALLMSVLVAAGAFGMAASTTLGFSPTEALNLFSPLLVLSAGYMALVATLMISDNPLTYMSGVALHQFLAHGPTWAVLAEAQQDSGLDDAGLPPHVYAGMMNAFASMLSLFGLGAIKGGPSTVLYVLAIMSFTSQACIRAGSLWAAAKQLARQAFADSGAEFKPIDE
ncbi:M6 [Symbiodinium natans]|uniref:M6 protein n=1 Tax=Symbiodinium natans TaxID=878477 RepID=A0A812UH82_9DINO|nr:M6 [Symbiodinium natans]